jgi:acetone carboxylase gamma subunit
MQRQVNKIVSTAETWEQAQQMVAEDKEANRFCKEIIRDATGRAWTAKIGREIDAFMAAARG